MSHVSFSWQNDNYDSVAAVVIALIREGKQWVACLLIISIVGDTCSLSCGLESGSLPSEAKICLVAKQSEDKTCKDYRQLFFFLKKKAYAVRRGVFLEIRLSSDLSSSSHMSSNTTLNVWPWKPGAAQTAKQRLLCFIITETITTSTCPWFFQSIKKKSGYIKWKSDNWARHALLCKKTLALLELFNILSQYNHKEKSTLLRSCEKPTLVTVYLNKYTSPPPPKKTGVHSLRLN